MPRVLCALADLDATGGKELVLEENGQRRPVFVIRRGDAVYGYVNSCPHARLPLNIRDDAFFDLSGSYILCANHGAYFDIATGLCTRGPCVGKSLAVFPVRVENGDIITA